MTSGDLKAGSLGVNLCSDCLQDCSFCRVKLLSSHSSFQPQLPSYPWGLPGYPGTFRPICDGLGAFLSTLKTSGRQGSPPSKSPPQPGLSQALYQSV